MRILFGFFLVLLIISGCSGIKNLKSPCVAGESIDGTPTPCIKRNANDHWLS